MKIIVFSGAGLSAPSGLSTFRDNGNGLWDNYKIEEVCSFPTWKKNRTKIFDFYNERRKSYALAQPNKAHLKLVELEKDYEVIHLTQNIDNLLEKAGAKNVIHLHGNIQEMKCHHCHYVWNIGDEEISSNVRCPSCSSIKSVKPNVVFFGEEAPFYNDKKRIFRNIEKDDIVIVIGTSGQVINISRDLSFCYGVKILCNKEKSEFIDESVFQHIIYGDIAIEIDSIFSFLKKGI